MEKRKAGVVAYIRAVSPRKRNKAFNISIQTDTTTMKKCICFDNTKIAKLKEKERSGEALNMHDVIISENQPEHFADILNQCFG